MKTKNLRLLLPAIALLGVGVGVVTWVLTSPSQPPSAPTSSARPPASSASVPTAKPAAAPLAPSPARPPVTAAEARRNFTLDAATARIGTNADFQPSADGLFDRAFIPVKGPTPIVVSIPELLAGEEVTVTAPNGGKLTRKNGPMQFTPKTAGPAQFDLAFEPTMGRGAYTITIRQAGALTTLDFWAGEPTPVGQPGPAYVATPSTDTSVESIP